MSEIHEKINNKSENRARGYLSKGAAKRNDDEQKGTSEKNARWRKRAGDVEEEG